MRNQPTKCTLLHLWGNVGNCFGSKLSQPRSMPQKSFAKQLWSFIFPPISTKILERNDPLLVYTQKKLDLRSVRKSRPQTLFWLNTLRGRDKMAATSQTTFSSAFSWMKIYKFRLGLKFVPKDPINNIAALVQIIAWRRPGDQLLSEPMMASLLTHICVTRSQWVKR